MMLDEILITFSLFFLFTRIHLDNYQTTHTKIPKIKWATPSNYPLLPKKLHLNAPPPPSPPRLPLPCAGVGLVLPGGFLEFQARFPELCEDSSQKCTPLTTQSQPCMPVANVGPTRILPFLYLGSQQDANNRQLLQVCPASVTPHYSNARFLHPPPSKVKEGCAHFTFIYLTTDENVQFPPSL